MGGAADKIKKKEEDVDGQTGRTKRRRWRPRRPEAKRRFHAVGRRRHRTGRRL